MSASVHAIMMADCITMIRRFIDENKDRSNTNEGRFTEEEMVRLDYLVFSDELEPYRRKR